MYNKSGLNNETHDGWYQTKLIGTETDLDIGYYERFAGQPATQRNDTQPQQHATATAQPVVNAYIFVSVCSIFFQ
jgi:hypothetical protein